MNFQAGDSDGDESSSNRTKSCSVLARPVSTLSTLSLLLVILTLSSSDAHPRRRELHQSLAEQAPALGKAL